MSRGRALIVALALSAAVVTGDAWTKQWATAAFSSGDSWSALGGLVRFTFLLNPGVAFGIGAGVRFPYAVFSILAALVILHRLALRPGMGPLERTALALILGGALGNLVDRVRLGEVVDWIEVGWGSWHFHVFNIADAAVSIGVILFALDRCMPDPRRTSLSPESHAHEPGARSLGRDAEQRRAAGSLPRGCPAGSVA
jgi:signal peptidase II